MNDGLPFLQLDAPGRGTIVVLMLVFGAMFLGAIFLQIWRERRQHKLGLSKAWKSIHEIIADKDLSEAEQRLLDKMLQEFSPDDPLRVVTVRRHFNEVVAAYLRSAWNTVNRARFAELGQQLRDIRVRLGLDFVPYGQPLESTRELAPRQALLACPAGKGDHQWFRFTVTQVDEAFIIAAFDQTKDEPPVAKLAPGHDLRARLWREDDARYTLTLRIASVQEDPRRVVFHHSTDLKRVQARAYYRVRHNQATSVGIVNSPANDDYEKANSRPVSSRMRGRVTSISAGGLAVEIPQNVPQQVLLRVVLELPATEPLTVTARVVGTEALAGGQHLVRGAFVDIDEETRDKIAHHVWRRQQPILNAKHAS